MARLISFFILYTMYSRSVITFHTLHRLYLHCRPSHIYNFAKRNANFDFLIHRSDRVSARFDIYNAREILNNL
jgi:hypothetical protein